MNEFDLIKNIRELLGKVTDDVVVGPGDDCAVISLSNSESNQIVMTVDCMVEGVHFLQDILTPEQIGRRAVSVTLSDIAAMGATPGWLLVSMGFSKNLSDKKNHIYGIVSGMKEKLNETGGIIVGGNITNSPVLFLSLTAIGTCQGNPILRNGALPGDIIAVTGSLGGANLALQFLKEEKIKPDHPLAKRHIEPPSRIKEGILLKKIAHACIDISDGLIQDLRHILEESNAGAIIEVESIPIEESFLKVGVSRESLIHSALCGGEDYELLFTLDKNYLKQLKEIEDKTGIKISVIGQITDSPGKITGVFQDGKEIDISLLNGWDHFR